MTHACHPSPSNLPLPPKKTNRLIGFHSVLKTCTLGASGIVFALMVIQNAATGAPRCHLYGQYDVPSALAPWLLMLLIQLAVPGASFLGHLAGLLAGEAWVGGLLERLALSDIQVAHAEAHRAYDVHGPKIGPCVASQLGQPPIWTAVRARRTADGGGSGSGGGGGWGSGFSGGSSVSSVAAARAVFSQGTAAAWARVPPQQKDRLLAAWARGRLAAVEKWRQLVAALPPPVEAAGASAHAAAAAFLAQHLPAAAALLSRSRGSEDGEDEETGGSRSGASAGSGAGAAGEDERAPLLAGVAVGAVGSAGGSANPSPARRSRPAGQADS